MSLSAAYIAEPRDPSHGDASYIATGKCANHSISIRASTRSGKWGPFMSLRDPSEADIQDSVDAWTHFRAGAPNIGRLVIGCLRRRRKLIGLVGLVFLLAAVVFGIFRQPSYTAFAQLLVFTKELQPGSDAVLTIGRTDTALVQNQVEILRSRNVLLKVMDNLKLKDDGNFSQKPSLLSELSAFARKWLPTDERRAAASDRDSVVTSLVLEWLRKRLSVSRLGTSHTIMVTFKDQDPERSARIVNEIVNVYLRDRGGALEADPEDNPWLRERLTNLGPNARVISDADVPIRPDGPRLILLLIGSVVFGLLLGSALALLLDIFDRTVRTSDQAEALCGVECLGIVPRYARTVASSPPNAPDGEPRVAPSLSWILGEPAASPASQTFRRIRALILGHDGPMILGLTSTSGGEGVTTVASNLAHFLAGKGSKVLLIDAAFHNPSLTRAYAPGPRLGLSDLASDKPLLEHSIISTSTANLNFLPIGQSSAREMDLDWNEHIGAMIRSVRSSYDAIVIDLPPLAVGAEVRVAAKSIDALLLVVQWGVTKAEDIESRLRLLGKARSILGGVLLNRASTAQIRSYGDGRFLTGSPSGEWPHSSAPGSARRGAGQGTPGRQSLIGPQRPENAIAKR